MSRIFQIPYLILLVLVPLGILWGVQGYGETRHLLSWVGGGLVVLAASYGLRVHVLPWGRRGAWFRFHRVAAFTAAVLILLHTAISPQSWPSRAAFAILLLAVASGLWVNKRKGDSRRRWRWFHLGMMPLLLGMMVMHGIARPRHDAFFPLATPYHRVTCFQCHPSVRSYQVNSCIGCHPHNDAQVFETHVLHGIPEEQYRSCLDCHITTIEGIRYGQPRAPGHAEIDWLNER